MRLYLRPIYHNIIYNTTIAEAEYTSDFELTKTPKSLPRFNGIALYIIHYNTLDPV